MLKKVVSLTRVGVRALASALGPEPSQDRAGGKRLTDLEEELAVLGKTYQELLEGATAMVRDRDEWRRKANEYHRVIEGIIGERDEWKKMWFADSSGHLEAQAMLDSALEVGRKLLMAVLQHLNALRKEHGLPEVGVDLKEIEAASAIINVSRARVAQQKADAPTETDWAAQAKAVEEPTPKEIG